MSTSAGVHPGPSGSAADPSEPEAKAASGAVARERIEWLLVAGVVLAVVLLGWATRWTSDDAFISFRVVDNLLAGNGPVYNAGERIEVATSPLWLAVLALADLLVPGPSVAWISVVLGIGATAAGVALACVGARRLTSSPATWLAVPFGAVVFAALPPVWDFTTSGLETGLAFGWTGLTFWGLVRWAQSPRRSALQSPWLLVVLGAGVLVRPDFAVFTVVLLGWLVLAARNRWWQRGLALGIAGLLPIAVQTFRMGYYGLLIPNTAVAKESGRALWGRGLGYLYDLVAPYLLVVPAVLCLVALVLAGRASRWRRTEWSLVGAVLVAAALHALYVVRVGGDFMHARLLLPSLFLALCPVAMIPIPRRSATAATALTVLLCCWAALTAGHLRVDYVDGVGPRGIADERGVYVRVAGTPNPVTLADRAAVGIPAYAALVAGAQADDRAVVIEQPADANGPLVEIAPSSGATVFSVANAGFFGVAPGIDVWVVDTYGLTDPIGSHLEAPPPGRPGHEKVLPPVWLMARFGSDAATRTPERPELPAPGELAAAKQTLACGEVAELLGAVGDELTWARFRDNVVGAPGRTSLRIPADPFEAERQFC